MKAYVEVDLLQPHKMWVVSCGGMSLTSLYAFPGCVVLVALFVDFWWASSGQSWRMGVHEELDSAFVGVFGPSLSAQLPVH